MPARLSYRLCRGPAALAVALVLAACAGTGPAPPPANGPDADATPRPVASGSMPGGQQAQPTLPLAEAADRSKDLVVAAMSFLDVRYRRGGDSAELGFDCSGFTRHVFATAAGVRLPRRAQEQARAPELQTVPRGALQPGDLVFFNTLRASFSHVGIYVGDGRFIHAPRSGASVRIEDMGVAYWRKRYDGGRRLADAAAPPDRVTSLAREGDVAPPSATRPAAPWPSPPARPGSVAAPRPSR